MSTYHAYMFRSNVLCPKVSASNHQVILLERSNLEQIK
uniref:Uncharacterized protein n=1 Tax=Anguilla anguilla TaxID=7936 RepID=A0A0E9SM64_ANGAN